MSDQLNQQVAELGNRIDKIERQLEVMDNPLLPSRILSLSESLRLLGWILGVGSLALFLLDWWFAGIQSWSLSIPIILGFWLALRGNSAFNVSDSTLLLMQEHRSNRRPHAAVAHKAHGVRLQEEALTWEWIVQNVGIALGSLIIGLLFVWGIVRWVPNANGQLLVIAAVLVALLAYALSAGWNKLSMLIALGLYLVIAAASTAIVSLLLLVPLSAWLGIVAVRRHNWNLMLLTVVATYAVMARWVLSSDGLGATTNVEAVAAEMVLLACITFGFPFVHLRRSAAERVKVRWIIGLNTLGFTYLGIVLIKQLVPAHWAAYVCVLLFAGIAFAGLSWQGHGRASYAKYYLLASLAGFLLSSILFLDPALVTLVWLMSSIVLLTGGFVGQSYTFRLAGLLALLATVVRYLGVTLIAPGTAAPVLYLHDRVWIGALLAVFLCVTGFWYRGLRSRGSEERLRLPLVAVLYALAALVLCSLFAVQVLNLTA